jgi:hypothetical protein
MSVAHDLLNMSVFVDCDIWFVLPVSLAKLHPFNAHIWKSPSPKSLFIDKCENDIRAQFDIYVHNYITKEL